MTGFREGNSQAAGLASNGDVLMVGYGSGLHQVDGAKATLVKANVGASFSAGAHPVLPRRTRAACGSPSRTASPRCGSAIDGHWIDEGRVPGITETSSTSWSRRRTSCGSAPRAQGAMRLRFARGLRASADRPLRRRAGAADRGHRSRGVHGVGGSPVFVAKQGVFRFDERGERVRRRRSLEGLSVGGTQDQPTWPRIARATSGRTSAWRPAVFRRQTDGSYRADKTALLRFADLAVAKIYAEDDGVVWFGRDDGLVRYDPSIRQGLLGRLLGARPPRDRRATGASCYGGAAARGEAPAMPRLGPRDNALRFEFASTELRRAPRRRSIRSMLEGFDPNWSAWTAESRRDYTNLPPGTFRFRVQRTQPVPARERRGRLRARHRSAVVRDLLGLPGGVLGARRRCIVGFVSLRTQKLRARAGGSRSIVADRTQEIRERETEVRAQADELRTLDEIGQGHQPRGGPAQRAARAARAGPEARAARRRRARS